MDLREYILPKNSMIGGWYIPTPLCDDLITLFKESEEYQQPGVVGPPLRVDPDEKRSTEVPIHPSYDNPTMVIYKNLIGNIVHLYEKKYPEVEEFSKFGMVESCQIQHYKPAEGFKKWHFERSSNEKNRCLVFMTYLNDVPDAGTHFKYQDLTTPAEKGLTLIWPTDFTHTHKGQITKTHEKYILTGWLGYI
jgi:prolyl 4-hydroxylase